MYSELKIELKKNGILYAEDADMKRYTTFRIGGICPLIIQPKSSDQLKMTVKILYKNKIGYEIFGRGSNILVSDTGIAIPCIYTQVDEPVISIEGNQIRVSSGTKLDHVAAIAADQGLGGVNFASGIPGTVGGAINGNAGAFGQHIGDAVAEVEIIARTGEISTLEKDDCHFEYRKSILKEQDVIILSALFNLKSVEKTELLEERDKILKERNQKHIDYHLTPCAGSFFKNIVQPDGKRIPAGKFLEESGCKELTYGDAAVYKNHANIIINKGNAAAHDVFMLSQMMQHRVLEKFGVKLEPEVKFLGKFD